MLISRVGGTLAAAALISGASAQSLSITIVARSGTAYPTLPIGRPLSNFMRDQFVASDGSVVFYAYIDAPGGANLVMCLATPSGPRIIAEQRTGLAGYPGTTYDYMDRPIALSGGRAVIAAALANPSAPNSPNTTSLVEVSLSGPVPIASWFQPPPGGPAGSYFSSIIQHCAVDSAQAFIGNVQTSPQSGIVSSGVWTRTAAGLQLAAIKGQQAAGFAPGMTHLYFQDPPSVNNSGKVVFNGGVFGPGGNAMGLWTGTPGNISLIAASDRPIGHIRPFRLGGFVLPSINSAGDVLFSAGASNTTQDPTISYFGLWRYRNGELRPLVVTGDAAPGTTGFYSSVASGNIPLFANADNGYYAYRGSLTGPGITSANNSGLWAGTSGNIRLVAQRGSQAAGLPAGILYEFIDDYAINARGQVVFRASLTGPGITGTNYIAIFYSQPNGSSGVVSRMGDMIPTGAGTEPVYVIEFSQLYGGTCDGRGAVLNDSGKVAFYLQILTGEHDAIATAQIPEPCYPNCDGSSSLPVLNINDLLCFLNRFAVGESYANCDNSTNPPVLTALDFTCFLSAFGAGCP